MPAATGEIPKLFLNTRVHTGQLREAAAELVDADLRVVGECLDRVNDLNPSLSPIMLPILLRTAIGPAAITDKTASMWHKRETWMTKLLVEVGSFNYPERVMTRASEFMDSTRRLASLPQARGYLNITERRLHYLASEQAQQGLDTLKLGLMTFVSNGLLSNAIHRGVYAQRAEGY